MLGMEIHPAASDGGRGLRRRPEGGATEQFVSVARTDHHDFPILADVVEAIVHTDRGTTKVAADPFDPYGVFLGRIDAEEHSIVSPKEE